MLETQNSSFAPKEHQEINLDDFLKNLNKSQIKIKNVQLLEKQDRKLEEKELVMFEYYFD